MALVEELKRSIERPAGDDVTGGAALKAGIQCRVVFFRRGRCELDLDIRMLRLESRNDFLLPDRGIVIAPALNGELAGRCGTGKCRHGNSREQHGLQSSL